VTCTRCGYELYVNPRATGTVIITDDDGRFLAIRRTREPAAGRWELPGGFCDGWEHPADAAVREAREELGLDVALTRFVGMYIGTYRYQDEDVPVLDSFWLARITGGTLTLDPAEADAHRWVPLSAPPPMAFATMDTALLDAQPLVAAG
jgi:8-oxo-dGTP diphosphatase